MDPKTTEHQASALRVITEQVTRAIEEPKCHPCGCLRKPVEALTETILGQGELALLLRQAHGVFQAKQYDCLGCPVCYPAIGVFN